MAQHVRGEKIEIFHQEFNSTTIKNAWNSEKRRQYQIEAGVLTGFILMFIQLIFGSFRRKSHNSFVKFLLWVTHSTSYLLVANTIGMMTTSSFDDELLVIWAMCLYMVLGCTDTFSAYSLEDNEDWKKQYYQLLLEGFYIGFLFGTSPDLEFSFFVNIWYILVNARVVQRISAFKMAGMSLDLQKNTKVIADHMKRLHKLNQEGQLVDPTCMSGYRYVVTGEENLMPKAGSHTIEIDMDAAGTITVDKVWKCKGTLLDPVRDSGSKLKDVCLSFALFKMLRRRFSGHPFAESQDQQTKDFVFKGLLSEDGDYERAFRVVEVELGFLYDYFFTKYPIIYLTERGTLVTSLLIISADFVVVWKLVTKKIYLETIITLFFVVLLIIFEISQIAIYLNSDWAKVSRVSMYVAKPHWQGNPWIEGALIALCREQSGKCWQNSLGQYSLLRSFRYQPKGTAIIHHLTFQLVDKNRKGQKKPWFVDIPVSVKREIISALKLINGYEQMKNGISSLDRNGVSTDLSRACSLQSDTQTILVWHVATTLCEIHTTNQQHPITDRITVASYLSNYCGYLVAFAPELLPDNKYDSELIFDNGVKEAKDLLRKTRSRKKVYELLIEAGDVSSSNTVLKGAGLAKELNVLDEPMRWQVLAEFWAEMILYIAPSDNGVDHLKHLTQGGEFVTHLWALLSHAGILERPPKTNRAGSETP